MPRLDSVVPPTLDVTDLSLVLSEVTWIGGAGVAVETGLDGLTRGGGNGVVSRVVLSAVIAASNSKDDCESSECGDDDCDSAGRTVASLSATSEVD